MTEKCTVMGAGHGGKAMAAQLALMGADVTLWNPASEHISIIKARRVIELESTERGSQGFGKLSLVASDIERAVTHAQIIMVVLPSSAHAALPKAVARCLRDGQMVILHPGRTVGALEFSNIIRHYACTADIAVGEAKWSVSELTLCVQEGLVN